MLGSSSTVHACRLPFLTFEELLHTMPRPLGGRRGGEGRRQDRWAQPPREESSSDGEGSSGSEEEGPFPIKLAM